MPLTVIIMVLVFLTVLLAALAIASRSEARRALVRRRVAAASPYGVGQVVQAELSRPLLERLIVPITRGVGEQLAGLTPVSMVESTRARLITAGRRTSAAYTGFFAAKAAVMLLLPLLYLGAVVAVNRGWPADFVPVLVSLGLLLAGWRLPDYWLDLVIGARKRQLVKGLPDALDLLTVCVEAGLGLDAAFATVADKFSGPIADEVGLTMYEVSLGKRRRDALRDLSLRTQVPELTNFVTAIIRAEQTGVNVGDILRVQADGMRVRRRQRAQELAQQAPVKMLFPLILGIFPALFIVILAPAIIQALKLLGGSP